MSLGCYDIEMRKRNAAVLVVLFSHSTKHHFKSVDFPADVLSIADKEDTYFTNTPDILANFIKDVSAPYDLVITIGGSKGGHGALYHGTLLARMTEKPVRVLAFSPVVMLSDNPNDVPYVSYQKLMERAQTTPDLAENLRQSTQVITADPPPNLTAFCIVGADNQCDCAEASRLIGAHILTLPMHHHETVIPFLCDTSDARAVTKTVLVLYDRAAEEADVAHLLEKGSVDKMIADLSRVPKQPRLDELTNLVIKGDASIVRQAVTTASALQT
ncbi:hypothetical protein RvVAT039_pl05030 (plasmid) [Agrobacterium vitis]|nr:hypothetical protein RvVAT039_pl05030 [Agrobacterium vitis]